MSNLIIHPSLSGFQVLQKPSSNVAHFGVNCDSLKFFIQFKNGVSYIFHDVPLEILNGAIEAESIGKYFNGKIARTYESDKVLEKLVREGE